MSSIMQIHEGNGIQTESSSNHPPELKWRVGVVYWEVVDAVVTLISDTLQCEGHQVVNFPYDAALPGNLDIVFVYGPYGSLVHLINQLQDYTPAQRPFLVFFHSEQFPNPHRPDWLQYPISLLRSGIEWLTFHIHGHASQLTTPLQKKLKHRALRFRYYGDLIWLRRCKIPFILAVASEKTADDFKARGFNNVVTTPGFFGFPLKPEWGADLKLERDIPVLWLGKPGSKRRERLVKRIRHELHERGVYMKVIDGIENKAIHGVARTEELNRTKVVLNLLRTEWDENSMRYYLAALNRALIVTEPTLHHHTRFMNEIHLVEAPIDQIANTICYYLTHEEERMRIVEQAFHLITTELTHQKAIRQILDVVAKHKKNGTSDLVTQRSQ